MRKRELGEAGRHRRHRGDPAGGGGELPRRLRRRRAASLSRRAGSQARRSTGIAAPTPAAWAPTRPRPSSRPRCDARVMPRDRRADARGDGEGGHARFAACCSSGLMIDAGVPRVLEYNVRFGDPETTVLVPLLDGRLAFALLDGAARGDLSRGDRDLAAHATPEGSRCAWSWPPRGIPAKPRTGDRIDGLGSAALADGAFVLHAGTARARTVPSSPRGARARGRRARIHARGGRSDRLPSRSTAFTGAASTTGATSVTRPRARLLDAETRDNHGRHRPAHAAPLRPRAARRPRARRRAAVRRHRRGRARRARRARPAQRRPPASFPRERATRSTRTPPRSSRPGATRGCSCATTQPAFYRYDQTFAPPGAPAARLRTRRGFLALVKLVPFSADIVLPHERTLSGPKEDRLKLFRATRTNLSPGFMLYRDPGRALDAALAHAEALAELADRRRRASTRWRRCGLGRPSAPSPTASRARRCSSPTGTTATRPPFATPRRSTPRIRRAPEAAEHKWFMVFLANGDDPDLVVFPTHRHVHGLGALRVRGDARAGGEAGSRPEGSPMAPMRRRSSPS